MTAIEKLESLFKSVNVYQMADGRFKCKAWNPREVIDGFCTSVEAFGATANEAAEQVNLQLG